MSKILQSFERIVVTALLGMMMLAVVTAVVELALILFSELLRPPLLLLNIEELLEVFGFFLMVLIGLELLETIKAYLAEDRVHAEIVLLVAIIALSRKVITIHIDDIDTGMLYGIATLILALGASYFLIRRCMPEGACHKEQERDVP